MYELFDNFLNEIEYQSIEQTLLNHTFPWYLNPIVGESWVTEVKQGHMKQQVNTNVMFAHGLYFKDEIVSDWFPHFTCLLDRLDIFSLLRIKINYLSPTTERIIHDFHVDMIDDNAPKNIKTAIYYLNTNNGVTIFEDSTEEVASVKNRMIIFPMHLRHTGTTHTEQNIPHRIVINFNYF